jgi:putative nucleotidyltransferase with HDIG domain
MNAPVSLVEVINRFIESDAVSLPVFNSASSRVQQEMAKSEPDIQVIEKIITSDQALSTQVLKIANSPFYRGLAEVGTVRAAILRLGMQEIEKVVLLATSQHHFKSTDKSINMLMKKLWQHAVGCAYGTVWLSRRYTYGVDQSQAFFGGLFHDVGKLLTLVIIEQVKHKNKNLKITEDLLLEAMAKLHAQEGAKLLAQWNMPEYFCVIARDHHMQEIDEKNQLLLLVRMANQVCHKLGIGLVKDSALILPSTLEAHLLNLTEIDLAELEIALEDTAVLTN